MGTSLFFEGERTSLRASLPLAATTRAEREEFFGTRMSRKKTIRNHFASADAKSCDALIICGK